MPVIGGKHTRKLTIFRPVDKIATMKNPKPAKKRAKRDKVQGDTQIVGFRLPQALAREVKAEAENRGITLRALFTELWGKRKEK